MRPASPSSLSRKFGPVLDTDRHFASNLAIRACLAVGSSSESGSSLCRASRVSPLGRTQIASPRRGARPIMTSGCGRSARACPIRAPSISAAGTRWTTVASCDQATVVLTAVPCPMARLRAFAPGQVPRSSRPTSKLPATRPSSRLHVLLNTGNGERTLTKNIEDNGRNPILLTGPDAGSRMLRGAVPCGVGSTRVRR